MSSQSKRITSIGGVRPGTMRKIMLDKFGDFYLQMHVRPGQFLGMVMKEAPQEDIDKFNNNPIWSMAKIIRFNPSDTIG